MKLSQLRGWIGAHKALCAVVVVTCILTVFPWVQGQVVLGDAWQGVPQSYADEIVYYSHMREIATGNFFFGNPYFLEHRYAVPLILFGSSILAALPLFLGLPLIPALMLNFFVWGTLFICISYALFRALSAPKLVSALASLFVFIQGYDILWRASSQQQVIPFLLLFYLALVFVIRDPQRKWRAVILGLSAGVTFYLYGFLWQSAVATLGLLVLYTLVVRNWPLLKRGLLASAIGGCIGLPPFLYAIWLTSRPYFWESMDRWGLVHTHLPVAEIVYSGGWVGITLLFFGVLMARVQAIRADARARLLFLFLAVTGMALWSVQGSNLITGKLLEQGEHLQRFIVLWLAFATTLVGVVLWNHRKEFVGKSRYFIVAGMLLLVGANLLFAYNAARRFMPFPNRLELWTTEQKYSGALAWLQANEAEPVVIWSDPHEDFPPYVTSLTRHYVLYQQYGYFNLMSNEEFFERYLVSQYFDQPTAESLKVDLVTYAGRAASYHHPKTVERSIKICRIIRSVIVGPDCGTPPTAAELLGDAFFEELAEKFKKEIAPNMQEYLAKYHVSYIVKDLERDSVYEPEKLGAVPVYSDGRFSVYRLPSSAE